MSLIDDLKAGFKDGDFNDAPFYPGATWYAKLPLNTASIVGLTPFAYVSKSEFSDERLFDIATTEEAEGGFVFVYLVAENDQVDLLKGCQSGLVTFGVIEDATGRDHILYRSCVSVYAPHL